MKSTTEVAKIFGVANQTILRWIANGTIKAIRPAGSYRISEEEIERLMKGEK